MVTNTEVIACGYAVSPGREREERKREGTHADDGVEDGSDGRDDGHDAAADRCARVRERGNGSVLETGQRRRGGRATNRQRWMRSVCGSARESGQCVLHGVLTREWTHGRADDAHGGWIREGEGGVGRGTGSAVVRGWSGWVRVQVYWGGAHLLSGTVCEGAREGKEQQTRVSSRVVPRDNLFDRRLKRARLQTAWDAQCVCVWRVSSTRTRSASRLEAKSGSAGLCVRSSVRHSPASFFSCCCGAVLLVSAHAASLASVGLAWPNVVRRVGQSGTGRA